MSAQYSSVPNSWQNHLPDRANDPHLIAVWLLMLYRKRFTSYIHVLCINIIFLKFQIKGFVDIGRAECSKWAILILHHPYTWYARRCMWTVRSVGPIVKLDWGIVRCKSFYLILTFDLSLERTGWSIIRLVKPKETEE